MGASESRLVDNQWESRIYGNRKNFLLLARDTRTQETDPKAVWVERRM